MPNISTRFFDVRIYFIFISYLFAYFDFLINISHSRGPRGERLQLVPIASSDGASITLGIDVKPGEEAEAPSTATPGMSLRTTSLPGGAGRSPNPVGRETTGAELFNSGGQKAVGELDGADLRGQYQAGFQPLEVLGSGIVPVTLTSGLVANLTLSGGLSQGHKTVGELTSSPQLRGSELLAGSGLEPGGAFGLAGGGLLDSSELGSDLPPQGCMTDGNSQRGAVSATEFQRTEGVLESAPRKRRSGGFARKRTRFGAGLEPARLNSGGLGKPFRGREPFGSRELIGESEAPVDKGVDMVASTDTTFQVGEFVAPDQALFTADQAFSESQEGGRPLGGDALAGFRGGDASDDFKGGDATERFTGEDASAGFKGADASAELKGTDALPGFKGGNASAGLGGGDASAGLKGFQQQAEAIEEEGKSLLHGMEAGFGSTESLPGAFERVLQNRALSEAQDDQVGVLCFHEAIAYQLAAKQIASPFEQLFAICRRSN
jgi:hypothetical protein